MDYLSGLIFEEGIDVLDRIVLAVIAEEDKDTIEAYTKKKDTKKEDTKEEDTKEEDTKEEDTKEDIKEDTK